MPPIDVDGRSTDRGKHLVDLLADGLGQPHPTRTADDPYLRYAARLGGASIALLFTGVVTVLIN